MSVWVLLRGLARDSRHWESFPARLRDALPEGAHVVTLDLPGNGKRAGQASPASVPAMVQCYRHQLRALDIGERPNVLGLSLGAMVAIEWATRHPHELASAVVVNGSAGGLSTPSERLRAAAAWRIVRAAFAASHLARERRVLAACTNLADAESASERWAAHSAQARTAPMNVLRQAFAAATWRLPQEKPRVPILVLASAADRLVSAECSIAIARRWRLPIVLHPTAGHEIALDDSAWLVGQCARWTGGMLAPGMR